MYNYDGYDEDDDDDYDDPGIEDTDDADPQDSDCFGCKHLDITDPAKQYNGICMIDRKPRDLSIYFYCCFGVIKLDNDYTDYYYAYKYNLK